MNTLPRLVLLNLLQESHKSPGKSGKNKDWSVFMGNIECFQCLIFF